MSNDGVESEVGAILTFLSFGFIFLGFLGWVSSNCSASGGHEVVRIGPILVTGKFLIQC